MSGASRCTVVGKHLEVVHIPGMFGGGGGTLWIHINKKIKIKEHLRSLQTKDQQRSAWLASSFEQPWGS